MCVRVGVCVGMCVCYKVKEGKSDVAATPACSVIIQLHVWE